MGEKLDDIKKLGARERLTKLKELEKKNKEEIELARKMIGESEREVEIEDELKDIPIPEAKAIDIDGLFSPDAKEVWKMKRFDVDRKKDAADKEEIAEENRQSALEETIAEEAHRNRELVQQQVQYGTVLEEAKSMAEKLAGAYDTIKNMMDKEYLSNEEQKRLDSYGDMAKKLYEEKFSPHSPADKDRMLAVEKMLYEASQK
jgi:hypothetical protein